MACGELLNPLDFSGMLLLVPLSFLTVLSLCWSLRGVDSPASLCHYRVLYPRRNFQYWTCLLASSPVEPPETLLDVQDL